MLYTNTGYGNHSETTETERNRIRTEKALGTFSQASYSLLWKQRYQSLTWFASGRRCEERDGRVGRIEW